MEELGGATAIAPEGFEEHGPYDVVLRLGGRAEPGRATSTRFRPAAASPSIGVGGGAVKAEINLLTLMGKRARIHGSTLQGAALLEQKADAARRVDAQRAADG